MEKVYNKGSLPLIPGEVKVGLGSSKWDSLPEPEDARELCGLTSDDKDKLRGFAVEHNSSC